MPGSEEARSAEAHPLSAGPGSAGGPPGGVPAAAGGHPLPSSVGVGSVVEGTSHSGGAGPGGVDAPPAVPAEATVAAREEHENEDDYDEEQVLAEAFTAPDAVAVGPSRTVVFQRRFSKYFTCYIGKDVRDSWSLLTQPIISLVSLIEGHAADDLLQVSDVDTCPALSTGTCCRRFCFHMFFLAIVLLVSL